MPRFGPILIGEARKSKTSEAKFDGPFFPFVVHTTWQTTIIVK